jgi:alpha-beta hydrolase superfamily lysophospholipase
VTQLDREARDHLDGTLVGRGGVSLHWQGWLPSGNARAILVFSHGLCDHGGRYAPVAKRLLQDGIATYAMDHRGHGRSHGQRANINRMALAAADLADFVEFVARRHPRAPRFLGGHSMGCVVGLECVLRHSPLLSGLALCAPTVDVSAAPALYLRCASALSRIAPGLGIISVYGRAPGDAANQLVRDDPLVHRGKAPARTIAELLASVRRLPRQLPRIGVPLLVQHGTADVLVPPRAAELVYNGVGSEDKLLKLYDGLGHEVFNSPDGERAREDLASWIVARA